MLDRCLVRLAAVLAVALVVTAPVPAAAAPARQCVTTSPDTGPDSWAVHRLQPERVWDLSTGAGVTVAVIDTGIDARQAHLAGRVAAGPDVLGPPGGPSTTDCTGHGTLVAGILAAAKLPGSPFEGIAPGARLLSIRQSDTEGGRPRGDTVGMARAIRAAVAGGARVINISVTAPRDDPVLRGAVKAALAADVVIVAAAGNDDARLDPAKAAKAVYYPAAYPGVLAVAGTDENDQRAEQSHAGFYVGIAAPGKDIVSTGPNGPGRYAVESGTSFAAPFVAGTAALVRAYHPRLSAAQVVARLKATADVPSAGRGGASLGAGIVNPYTAVTSVLPGEGPPSPIPPGGAPALPAAPLAPDHHLRDEALSVAGAVGVFVLVVLALAAALPRGRSRRWRPGRRAVPEAGDRPLAPH